MKKALSMLLSLAMILTMFTALPVTVSAATVNVDYIDENGGEQTVSANVLSGSSTSISPGWYVVLADTTFNNRLELKLSEYDTTSDFNIIIADGETATFADKTYGIFSDDPVTLNIYSQSKGTGKIKSQNGGDLVYMGSESSSFRLFGGTVSAPDDEDIYTQINSFGRIMLGGSVLNTSVYAKGELTVNGGIIHTPVMSSEKKITVNAGMIECTDPDVAAIESKYGEGEIVLNLTDSTSSIKSTSYSGKVQVSSYLTDDDGNIYNLGTIADNSAIENKTLRHTGHVHNFSSPTWEWDGYTLATATFVCLECGETYAETATGDAITEKVIYAPTETENGRTDYTAELYVNVRWYLDTKSRTTHTGKHTFGNPVWNWDGYDTATLTLTCTVDDEVVVTEAEVTHETTAEPTYTKEGTRAHTAKATVQDKEYIDVQTEVLPKLDRGVTVNYLNLSKQTKTAAAERIIGDETTLSSGWYAVTEDVEISGRVYCDGIVNLILCDGATYTAHKGIGLNEDSSLTIWAQSEGGDMGKLVIDSPKSDAAGIGYTITSASQDLGASSLTVNGGDLNIRSSRSYAIGGVFAQSFTVTINGGNVSASTERGNQFVIGAANSEEQSFSFHMTGGKVTLSQDSSGSYPVIGSMSDGEIRISGGELIANGSIGHIYDTSDVSILLDWKKLDGCKIYAEKYKGDVTLLSSFTDGTNIYKEGAVSDSSVLEGKTLTPTCDHAVHTAPAWTWNTSNGNLRAVAEDRCAKCLQDARSFNATITARDELFERHYIGSVKIDGVIYTDECPEIFDRTLNILVGGTYISKDNYTDVLGDGTVSYDVDTNTLTLENATIPLKFFNNDASPRYCGIRYNESSDLPFNIVLKGDNVIDDIVSSDSQYQKYGILIFASSPGYTISGDGSLRIKLSSNTKQALCCGIHVRKALTVDGCDIDIDISGSSEQKGVEMMYSDTTLSLKGGANVTIHADNAENSYAVCSSANVENLDVESGSRLDAFAANSAIDGNINLTDSTKSLGVAVTSQPDKSYYSVWDGTTPLNSYSGIVLPKTDATYRINVSSDIHGTITPSATTAKPGDIITVTSEADKGYALAYLSIETEGGVNELVHNSRFTMPADNVNVIANFYRYVPRVEPYVNDDGEYILGEIEHFARNYNSPIDVYYSVNENGCLGEEITDFSLSYFDFEASGAGLAITKYTGPTRFLTKLEIPKTYQGKKIEVLGNGNPLFRSSSTIELVMGGNVTRIRDNAFSSATVTKVSGDTSKLKQIDALAFARGNNKLDITLDYTGSVFCGANAFYGRDVTVHLKHATTLSGYHRANRLTYEFTDEHIFGGEVTWRWNDALTAATAVYHCADSRCSAQGSVEATLTSEINGNVCTITAAAVIDGVTYTDTKTKQLSETYVAQVEPYIDSNGAYILGTVEHYEVGSKYYAVNEDGTAGSELSDLSLSYFTFKDNGDDTWTITRYTAAVTANMDLLIPKTYDGKAITALGSGDRSITSSGNTFNVYLTENITTINKKCFSNVNVALLTGDTSNLNKIGEDAFAYDRNQVHLYLDYSGLIINDTFGGSFRGSDVVCHMKHATHFLGANQHAIKLTYDFTDDHIYGDQPTWEWENDYSAAKAVMTCADDRCKHTEKYDAAVTATKAVDKTIYTATVEIDGTTYTDTVEVLKTAHTVTAASIGNGTVTADKETAYEGEKVTLTLSPADGYLLVSLTVKDANGDDVPVSGLSFTMPDNDVTVTAEFKQSRFAITYSETVGGWARGVYSADEGTTVTLEVTSASGYERDTLTVTDSSDHEITVTNNTFTMPASDVTVTATFKKKDLNITYHSEGNGTVSGAVTAQFNDEVVLTVTPDDGYALLSLYAETDDGWGDSVNIIDSTLIMADTDVTVTAEFVPYTPMKEPYIDENGAYILGNIAYAEINGVYYEVKGGVVGDKVDSVELSYFDFASINSDTEYQIRYYTGPTATLSKLEIPATFNGKPITVLGCDNTDRLYEGTKTQFELVLTKNIREIKSYTFYVLYVTKVSGDTSGLRTLGSYAFSWANSPGGYDLDIELDYAGKITTGSYVFNHMNVTMHLKHATTFSNTNFNAQKVTYDFTDAHLYSTPTWTWADDYSSAAAVFTCTDTRCKYQESVNATVTKTEETSETEKLITYTAAVEMNGKTYTDTKQVTVYPYYINVSKAFQGTVTADAAQAYAGDEITLTVTPEEEYTLSELTVTDEYGNEIEVTDNKFIMPGSDVSVVARFAVADGIGARLVGHSISLDGDIGVNFYMELSDSVVAHKDTAKMHFVIPTGKTSFEQEMLVRDAVTKEVNDITYYVFKCRVAAKEMTSEIKAQIIDGDRVGTEYTYSVKEYADYLLDHADERVDFANAATLVRKMLNYGAYAQIYFDKNPADLANADLDEADKTLGDVTVTAPDAVFDLPEGVTFEGATLSLKSETSLSLYFKSDETLTFSVDGKTVETVSSGGYQIARIRSIPAKELKDSFTLNITAGEASGSVTYSPMNYCYKALNGGTSDTNLQNVMKALYLYAQAADAYFR